MWLDSRMDRMQSLKFMVGAMATAPIMIGLVFGVGGVLPDATMVHGAEAAVTVGLSLLGGLIGYFGAPRLIKPLEPARDHKPDPAQAMTRIQAVTPVAAAVAESGFLLAIAVAFVLPYSGGALLVAAPVGALAVYFAAFPSPGRVETYKRRLESAGGRSGL